MYVSKFSAVQKLENIFILCSVTLLIKLNINI